MWQVWKLTGFVSECQTEQGVWTFCLVHWVLNWGIRVQALAGIMSCILCHVKEAVIYNGSKNRLYLQEMARIFVDNLFHILFLIVLFTLKIQYFNYKLFSIMDYRSFLNQFLCLISFFFVLFYVITDNTCQILKENNELNDWWMSRYKEAEVPHSINHQGQALKRYKENFFWKKKHLPKL